MTEVSESSAVGDTAAGAVAPAQGLHVRLDSQLPRELAVGAGTALFVNGCCFCPRARVRSLAFVVNGQVQPVSAYRMPRLDVFRSFHQRLDPFALAVASDPESRDDPFLHSYRSGFWGIVQIAPGLANDVCELLLRADLEGGGAAFAELGRISLVARPDVPGSAGPALARTPSVAICMATYNPPLDLLERQIGSIRGQTHRDWICFVSDDCSSPEHFAAVQRSLEDDPRFVVSRSPRRLGFYANFERALSMVPPGVEYVAMADQDDSWYPDKLETLLDQLGSAQLVYSDARVVDRQGELISETYWPHRRNNHTDLLSLLVANAVTGAASLFRRELLEYALPFPADQFAHYHDHWIGLTALALGEIEFVERPLYDYVQHAGASLGHAAANRIPVGFRERVATLRDDPRDRVRMWRLHYFADACRLLQFATVLKLRCGDRMPAAKRRTLDRFLRTERSLLALAKLGWRGALEFRGRPETLGAEWMLFYAFAWRRLLAATARDRPQRRLRLDAVPPLDLVQKPVRSKVERAPRTVAEKVAPLALTVRADVPPRVNILVPTIDLGHFFGGYIAKLNLARRLAERGIRTRIVTVDPVGALPTSWAREIESYSGLDGIFDRVEVAFARESHGLDVSPTDRFVATTWWTAHIARDALRSVEADRFLYLIQEYEPFTFPMGTFAALARESYRFPHFALFSTELLRDYFRRHGAGVYADGTASGDRESLAFENAITPIDQPSVSDLAGRRTRRLLFYARPEPHAARNLFELGVLALAQALEGGSLADGWELHGIGTVEAGRRIALGANASMELLPRSDQARYAQVLREHDLGLALMYTPHPSLVPIEMASAGMLTVTNSFENKTPDALAAISSNLITAEPNVNAIAAGLEEAAAAVDDFERRARGSDVHWSRDWNRSFDDELMARVTAFLTSPRS